MEKGDSICMSGPGYRQCGVKYTQRLTYGGEYLHSAPWNMPNIKRGVDSSNGCTNLDPTAAQTLYKVLEVGDVVSYPNAAGPMVDLSSGYGDWNVPWSTWLTGGLVPTS
jgi:lipoprotein-anchoring transpeptidase ErfK/SrfK